MPCHSCGEEWFKFDNSQEEIRQRSAIMVKGFVQIVFLLTMGLALARLTPGRGPVWQFD
jgi:hypothetical protein